MIELSSKYKLIPSHDGRYFIITGGRGSGKSYAISLLVLLLTFEANQSIIFTRFTKSSAGKSIIPELQEKIDVLELNQYFTVLKDKIVNNYSKSEISFMGINSNSKNNTAKMKSLSQATTFVLDEGEELRDEELFDKIDYSFRKKGIQNRIIISLNPQTKKHWIYERFFGSKGIPSGFNGISDDTCYVHTTYKDNVDNVEHSWLNRVKNVKRDNPEKYRHIFLGHWAEKGEHTIYTNWGLGDFNDDLDYHYGADWGYKEDPTTLIKVAIDKRNKKIYLHEELYDIPKDGKGLSTSQISSLFKKICGSELIVADSAEPRLIDEVRANGVNIKPCKKGAGSIKEGIKIIQDYRLIITPTSTNLITELNEYSWIDNLEKPRDMFNHLLDSARYAITHDLRSSSGIYHIY